MFTTLELEQLNREFETADPQTVLRWAAQTFGDQFTVVTSFQPTGIVTLHMLSEIAPRTPVLTLDTGLLFQETYNLTQKMELLFNLNLIQLTPALTVAQQNEQYGDNLWERDPDTCCHIRKVVPLKNVLPQYAAWATGLRRDQTGRAEIPIISWDKQYNNVKISPLATWTEEMMWIYIRAYDLPYNELHDQGYPSIGCYTCTQAVAPDAQDRRAGRWSQHHKTECGIHVIK